MGRKALDLTGTVSHRLTVIKRVEGKDKQNSYWLCKCSCEAQTEFIVSGINIKSGNTTSCGCVQKENYLINRTMDGESNTKEYKVWVGIKHRISNPQHKRYHRYGGRGITMDLRWEDYFVFLEDIGRAPDKKSTLDRIDNDKGYYKDNVRWVSYTVQNNNRGDYNVRVTINGQTKSISEWAVQYGYNKSDISALRNRIKNGWLLEEAFSVPVKHLNNKQ